MKKLNLAKIISLIFVCAMLMGTLMITAFATGEQADVEIISKNVYFGDTLQLMFAVKADEGATVTMTGVDSEGNEFSIKPYNEYNGSNYTTIKGVGAYVFLSEYGVAAQNIDEVVTVTATVGNESDTISYSVLEYLFERLYVSNDVTNQQRTMYENLIGYANAADIVINKASENASIANYFYVTVEGATLDGVNTAGIALAGTFPFENITTDLVAGANQSIKWEVTVGGYTYEAESLADLRSTSITDNMHVVATVVDVVCDHSWIGATCTTPATCELCGVTDGDALGHDIVIDEAVAPSCTDTGLTEGQHCSRCDDVTVEQVEVPTVDHTWLDANCQAPATCDVCGETDGEKLGHHVNDNGDNVCDVCDEELASSAATATITFNDASKRAELTSSKQVWVENGITFTNNKASSTNNVADYSNPVRLYKGSEIVIEFPGMTKIVFNCAGSSYVLNDAAGAVVNGTTVTVTFDTPVDSFTVVLASNQVRFNSITVEANSTSLHVFGEQEVTKEATCTEKGTLSTVCQACGESVDVEIPALGHNETTVEGYAATCTETGLTDGKYCDACDTMTVEQTEIPALGHTWGEWVEIDGPTCSAEGSQMRECDCGELEEDVIPATGEHNDGDGDGYCDGCDLDMNTDEAKAEKELGAIDEPQLDFTAAGTIELDNTPDEYDATIEWAIVGGTNKGSTLDGNVLDVVLNATATTIELKVTVTVGDASVENTYTINVAAQPPVGPTLALEITKADFNSTSYAANNNTKNKNGYSYTSYQVMNQNSTMQWQKSKGYITITADEFVMLEIKASAGTFTVTVGGQTVSGTTENGVTTYDLTGLTGEIKISVGSVTGKVDYINFYK